MNPIELSLFVSRMEAICDEMGVVLRRTAFSPNIKDRLDFSCALFDAKGELCAQAAHIPVHLGSMAFALAEIVNRFDWHEGDIVILNDPFLGGTHLPDVTVLAPVFADNHLAGFVVNRAHHANIGSDSPGSMPNSSSIEEEGLVIAPQYLYQQGKLNQALAKLLRSLNKNPDDKSEDVGGDFAAQLSALYTGKQRLQDLINNLGFAGFQTALEALNRYGENLAANALKNIPVGSYCFEDVMDDDGLGNLNLVIKLKLIVSAGNIVADFEGTVPQVKGNINCPLSVTAAAVYYVFRCLMPELTPACAGIFRRIKLSAPVGCLVNARYPAAVVAGNVETSSRLVDVVLGALSQALPDKIPAASQGSMNNIAMGNYSESTRWDYYETLAGGMGAGPNFDGLSAVHTHMINTLNTPVESLEMHLPIRINSYALRENSGGSGLHTGGNGLERVYEFLEPTQVSILSERRAHPPWGLAEGKDGSPGLNLLDQQALPAKCSFLTKAGQRLSIQTPGGGGWGK
ncbi:MAG: 5-oxoprolinase [SAR86 cluster bacterium]|uniref:5-oxoprolinase n=1 Tax=SAR86 cluster bacterium TaxID=2030880 RepID=A0A2A5C6U6_9GAMM|nr:MAG: 5-oxoprolinase [SAR86 cluster bacterium]